MEGRVIRGMDIRPTHIPANPVLSPDRILSRSSWWKQAGDPNSCLLSLGEELGVEKCLLRTRHSDAYPQSRGRGRGITNSKPAWATYKSTWWDLKKQKQKQTNKTKTGSQLPSRKWKPSMVAQACNPNAREGGLWVQGLPRLCGRPLFQKQNKCSGQDWLWGQIGCSGTSISPYIM